MRKTVAMIMVGVMMCTAISVQAKSGDGRGGVMGFISGCCFGIRAGADYNSGKEIHWREWCGLIPYVGIVFAIWNGIDGASGITSEEYAEQYGSMYY